MKKILTILLIGIIIGVVVTLLILSIYSGSINENSSYGFLEWVYYLTQPVGVLATTFAVIVALFGKEIRAFYFKEKCTINIANGGFYENCGREPNSTNPVAHCYDCCIKLTNDGGRQIESCELVLKEVSYKDDTNGKYRRIFSSEHKALYWDIREIKEIPLYIGETRTMPLYKIYPDSSCQTPDGNQSSPLCMRVIGCSMQEKYTKKGIWKSIYEIRTKSNVLSQFEVIAEWDGVWCNRSTEMDDHVSANLIISKK